MTEPSRAVFLSYASQDAEAAARICAALRSAGIEVWFDQSELRGGEAWDRQIRKQIHDCALFVPVISANAHARVEGYFRLEWKLAVDRSHLMAPDQTFLLPVVIDDTPQADERIPDRFRELQWSRLPNGYPSPAFTSGVLRLLAPESTTSAHQPVGPKAVVAPAPSAMQPQGPKRAWPVIVAVLLAAALAYIVIDKLWTVKLVAVPQPETSGAPAAAPSNNAATFAPPPHSIAVLPFVNMSGDKEQEYFSDGLSEELLNDLARINELQVAARTSAFSFKGKDTDIGTIARKLNVGAVLEGSVRRSAHRVRVAAQLINAVTGFHLWSQTYDRDLGDVLKLQTEIASAVASALKVTLLGDAATGMKVGGTRNPAAYDAYLRSTSAYWHVSSASDNESVRAGYEEAVRLDPNFALAYAELSVALNAYASLFAHGPAVSDFRRQAQTAALKAVALAPELAEGHLALAIVLVSNFDFTRAGEEFQRAVALGPGNARVLKNYGRFAVNMGHTEVGLAVLRRAVVLDPLNATNHGFLIDGLQLAKRYDESLTVARDASSLFPDDGYFVYSAPVWAYAGLGDFQNMRRLCEALKTDSVKNVKFRGDGQRCLAIADYKLGRRADAETALKVLKTLDGDDGAYDYAQIYAQWGRTTNALDRLETALRLHNLNLQQLKVDPLLDPLRDEPRFQAIERELKFPN